MRQKNRNTARGRPEARVRREAGGPGVVSLADIGDTGVLLDESQAGHETDHSVSPELSAGDVDARWDQAESAGEETAGGSVATPDQDVVDEIGRAIGVTYEEGEPLRVGRKELERDQHRWELDPASAEDFASRSSEAAHDADRVRKMRHQAQYGRNE